MTETLDDVSARKMPAEESAEQRAAAELVRLAKEQGLSLTGPDGLLKQLTKTVLESALAEEMTEHLGYEKHTAPGGGSGNIRPRRAKQRLGLAERVFRCAHCGYTADLDHNAARVILAMAELGHAGTDGVRHRSSPLQDATVRSEPEIPPL